MSGMPLTWTSVPQLELTNQSEKAASESTEITEEEKLHEQYLLIVSTFNFNSLS